MMNLITPNINFKAKSVKTSSLRQVSSGFPQQNRTCRGTIIEIDTASPDDINILEETVKSWGDKDSYGKKIVDDAKALRIPQKTRGAGKIYAVTLQQNRFDKLEGDKILGLCEVTLFGKDKAEINFLQTKPEHKYNNDISGYKHIGKSFVKMLQGVRFKTIVVQAAYDAANFYEKMNFKIIDVDKLIYEWKIDKTLEKITKSIKFNTPKNRLNSRIHYKF